MVAVPGIIIGILLARTIREPDTIGKHVQGRNAPLREPMRHRNVPLGMFALFCAMSGIFTISANIPSYLVDHLNQQWTNGLL
jgi:predicted MFS family arabinose efflux permease